MVRGGGKEVKFVLRTLPSGQYLTVGCRETTAKAFGWFEHFETIEERRMRLVRQGMPVPAYRTYPMLQSSIGKPIRIVGDNNRRYTIRIGSKVRLTDLAELAHFTKDPWLWMERPDGARWTREQWAHHWNTVSLKAA